MSDRELSTIAEKVSDFILAHAGHPTTDLHHSDDAFNVLALQLFRLQYERIEPYQRYCRMQRPEHQEIKLWKDIPALPVAAWKQWKLTSIPEADRSTVFHSSGTTRETKSQHFHSSESLRIYDLSLLNWFNSRFINRLSRGNPLWVILTPTAIEAPHSSLVYMLESIRRAFGGSDSRFVGYVDPVTAGWSVDLERAQVALCEAIATSRPVVLMGTAFNFVHLLDHLAEQGVRVRLPKNSWAMETGGYKGRSRAMSMAELHALIEFRLGIAGEQIVSEYGMCELSSQAYNKESVDDQTVSTGKRRVFRFPPWGRVQIISPETGREVGPGESGLIRVFDLANVYSLMAIQTEDLAVRCPDGFELVGRVSEAEPRGCSLMSISE